MTWIESRKSLQLGELVEVPGWHRHPLSGGTTTPRAVPTRARQRRVESGRFGVITGHVRCTPPRVRRCTAWSPPLGVWCHCCFPLERGASEGGHRHGHRQGDGGAPPYFSKEGWFRGLGWDGHRHPRGSVPPSCPVPPRRQLQGV